MASPGHGCSAGPPRGALSQATNSRPRTTGGASSYSYASTPGRPRTQERPLSRMVGLNSVVGVIMGEPTPRRHGVAIGRWDLVVDRGLIAAAEQPRPWEQDLRRLGKAIHDLPDDHLDWKAADDEMGRKWREEHPFARVHPELRPAAAQGQALLHGVDTEEKLWQADPLAKPFPTHRCRHGACFPSRHMPRRGHVIP
eukprot:TRINITY_DN3688_c2_g1_i2.p2 TRINITY_DN3688_c2_g1~~TRINITY_DN3688_c2_g1_i2.p2  ORF type:complete len:197 (-),score=20.46 TRINITY_DN3688_c2_g1_i2:417-1007(-)